MAWIYSPFLLGIAKLDLLDWLCFEMSSLLVVQCIKEQVAWVGRWEKHGPYAFLHAWKIIKNLDWIVFSQWKTWTDFFNLDGTGRQKVEPLFLSKVSFMGVWDSWVNIIMYGLGHQVFTHPAHDVAFLDGC